ncbi:MAG: NAD-dependent succinate-semialdehyde dehydrogenase [Atopostipes sp.]|nr:NAD-dependent succinate-semialdehyde dehydrogenase [Atopostipes sp.]MDN6835939.1 NAD-dependent succinate-semialdehyde dehydrogenase [Lactococcus lactis]
MAYQTINPYTNELVKEYPDATDEELEETLKRADNLYEEFKTQDIKERAKLLRNVAKEIRDRSDEMARTLTIEMGKLIGEAKGEVELIATIADFYADNAEEMLAPKDIETDAHGKAAVHYQSTGVIMMVEPWNFPYYQIMRVFAPNFMVGNPMILKHASNTPSSAQLMADVIEDAGTPKGSLTNMFLSYDQVADTIADPRVQGAALTGSERGGSSIGETAGKHLKQSTLELGGMDPFIVLDDADMEDVYEIAWRSRLYNAGQECTSSKRFIVMEEHYDDFVEKLKENFDKVKPGDPLDPDTTLAPMNSKSAKEKLQEQLDEAIEAGANVVYGNEPIDLPGQFFKPTILTDVDRENPAHTTEMFGPVAVVYKVSSEQEAIELANDSPYGLGAIVFSGDQERGEKVALQIETGMVFVNSFRYSLPELPFGGVKNSGYGREMSDTGLMAFVNEKLVLKADEPDMDNLASGLVASSELD